MDIERVLLPNIGTQYSFHTEHGHVISVIRFFNGYRDLLMHDNDVEETVRYSSILSAREAQCLARLLYEVRSAEDP